MIIYKDDIKETVKEIEELLIAKNADYGSSVGTSPVLLPELNPLKAVMVRMSDKIVRLQYLSRNDPHVKEETFLDTLKDLAGYCILYMTINRKQNEYECQCNAVEIE